MEAIALLAQAQKESKLGEGKLKTSFFKKKPNYGEALAHFQDAADIYEKLGKKEEAQQALLKLAECARYSKLSDMYLAGQSYEKAAKYLYALTGDTVKALEIINKSSEMYNINGTSSKGQAALRKFAKECIKETDKIPFALEIYKQLFEDLFTEENYLYGSDLIDEYVSLLLCESKFYDVIKVEVEHIKYLKSIKTEHTHLIRRAWLAAICMFVLSGEDYLADEKMTEFLEDCEGLAGDEWKSADNLLRAYRDRQKEKYMEIIRKPIFMQINIEIVKRLKKVNVPWTIIDAKKEIKKKEELKEININLEELGIGEEKKTNKEPITIEEKKDDDDYGGLFK